MSKILRILPGFLVCLIIAIPCYYIGTLIPVVGGPVFAILTGMIISIFWKDHAKAGEGIGFTSKKILQLAVILLGFGLNLNQIAQVGITSLPIILLTISTSLIVAFAVSKALKIPGEIATLIGVGSSICGGSAIAATAPVIKARDEEVAQSISVIFLFNVIAALIFPSLGSVLGLTNEGFGLFAGTAVNDTSSVTAAAAAWDGMHSGSNALDYATIVKLTRTLAIIPITLVLALWVSSHERKLAQAEGGSTVGGFSLKKSFPMFILFFVFASIITTIATSIGVNDSFFDPFSNIAKFLIIMAMAAIGLGTDVVKLIKSGAKPLLLGLTCWIAIACVSLAMQHVIGLW